MIVTPDFLTVTKNAIAISHYILSPIEPSQYGFTSKSLLLERLANFKDEVIDVRSRESYITAQTLFIGNRIRHNTKSSKEFSQKISEDKNVIALIPEKELFNRSTLDGTPIVEMQEDKEINIKNKTFFNALDSTFHNITNTIEK